MRRRATRICEELDQTNVSKPLCLWVCLHRLRVSCHTKFMLIFCQVSVFPSRGANGSAEADSTEGFSMLLLSSPFVGTWLFDFTDESGDMCVYEACVCLCVCLNVSVIPVSLLNYVSVSLHREVAGFVDDAYGPKENSKHQQRGLCCRSEGYSPPCLISQWWFNDGKIWDSKTIHYTIRMILFVSPYLTCLRNHHVLRTNFWQVYVSFHKKNYVVHPSHFQYCLY